MGMEALLVVEEGPHLGSSWTVREGKPATLGRGPGVQVRLDDAALLPKHATLALVGAALTLTDLGGPAGTLLDGRRVPAGVPTPVGVGAVLRLGSTALRVEGEGLARSQRETVRMAGPVLEDPLLPPGEFEVLRELGRGAMGQVLAVRRLADGRALAAKLLLEDVDPASEGFQRFLAEGRAAARIQSPFVVGVVDLRLVGRRAALLLELVEGPTLAQRLERGLLAVPDALRAAEDVAEALAAAHAAGVVHRDVKPANVLLDPRGAARLTDFGLAKELTRAGGPTRTGQGLGTLFYVAPEQLLDAKRVGPAADLHALGALLYHCLAGAPPHVATTLKQLMHKVVFEPPPPLALRRPDAPPEALRLVEALLAKEPADRGVTARQAADALREVRLRRHPGHRGEGLFAAG